MTIPELLFRDAYASVCQTSIGDKYVVVEDADGNKEKCKLSAGINGLAKFRFHKCDYYLRREMSGSGQVFFCGYRLVGDYLALCERVAGGEGYIYSASELYNNPSVFVRLS